MSFRRGDSRYDLWRHRSAAPVQFWQRIVLSALTGVGVASLLRLANWWFRPEHVGVPLLFGILSLAFWYGIVRIALGWVNYAAIGRPEHKPAPADVRVAIFTTSSPGEPLEMFERTLAACAAVRYPHTTYLLDDTRDARFAELARRCGAKPLELIGLPGAKAGKINRALELTSEDFILVLDPDHVPFPEFLDRVLGHFADDAVGFVQVPQAYYNQRRSFTARGGAEQTYMFYGPGQMGLHGHGACVAIGANCTFRRAALESIGGHGVGLAEDLITAIRLHAKGWRSLYVPEVVSRGLVPEDLGSFYKQQIKWARGVYEVAFTEWPHLFTSLTWRQRLSYVTIGTYYLFGVTALVFLLFPYLYLWGGIEAAHIRFVEFITYGAPVAVIGMMIYGVAQVWLCHRDAEWGMHWRGLILKMGCWPIFLAGTLLAVTRSEVPYIPTEKRAVRNRFLRLAWPQLAIIAAFVITLARVVWTRALETSEASLELTTEAVWGMVAFAAIPVIMAIGVLYAAWEARSPAAGSPWDVIDVATLGGDGR